MTEKNNISVNNAGGFDGGMLTGVMQQCKIYDRAEVFLFLP